MQSSDISGNVQVDEHFQNCVDQAQHNSLHKHKRIAAWGCVQYVSVHDVCTVIDVLQYFFKTTSTHYTMLTPAAAGLLGIYG
jgi:hypothetical protein